MVSPLMTNNMRFRVAGSLRGDSRKHQTCCLKGVSDIGAFLSGPQCFGNSQEYVHVSKHSHELLPLVYGEYCEFVAALDLDAV